MNYLIKNQKRELPDKKILKSNKNGNIIIWMIYHKKVVALSQKRKKCKDAIYSSLAYIKSKTDKIINDHNQKNTIQQV